MAKNNGFGVFWLMWGWITNKDIGHHKNLLKMVQTSCFVDRKIVRSPSRVNVCLIAAALPKRHLASPVATLAFSTSQCTEVVEAYAQPSLNVLETCVTVSLLSRPQVAPDSREQYLPTKLSRVWHEGKILVEIPVADTSWKRTCVVIIVCISTCLLDY